MFLRMSTRLISRSFPSISHCGLLQEAKSPWQTQYVLEMDYISVSEWQVSWPDKSWSANWMDSVLEIIWIEKKKSMTLLEMCIKPCHQHVQISMSGYRFTPSLSPAFARKILTELHVHLKHDKFDLEKIVFFFFINSPKLDLLVCCFLLKNIKREGDSK